MVITDPRHTEKTKCHLGYHHSGLVTTHALWHMMYGYTLRLWLHGY